MLKTQSVSQQDADTKIRRHAGEAARCWHPRKPTSRGSPNWCRTRKCTAPFDGVVTARNVDVGALVTAGGTPGSRACRASCSMSSRATRLRVFVDVPQDDAPYVTPATRRVSDRAAVSGPPLRRDRSRAAPARSTRRAARCASRSTSTTSDGALLPGAYAQVHLQLAVEHAGARSAGQRPAVPAGRRDGRGGRQQRAGSAQDRDTSAAISARMSKSRPASRRPTA